MKSRWMRINQRPCNVPQSPGCSCQSLVYHASPLCRLLDNNGKNAGSRFLFHALPNMQIMHEVNQIGI